MSHLEEGVLHAMLDGEIESAELQGIKAHLAACEGCTDRLEEARRFRDDAFAMITALDEQPAVAGADRGQRAQGWKRLPAWAPGLAWAATIFAAIGLGWSLQGRPSAGPGPLVLEPRGVVAVAPPTLANQTPPVSTRGEPEPSATRERLDRQAATVPTQAAAAESPAPVPPARTERPSEIAVASASKDQAAGLEEAKAESRLAKKSLAQPAGASAEGLSFRVLRDGTWTAISAARAIEALGGSIKLIDGLKPTRYEQLGDLVRVGYETTFGPVVLEQWRAANVVSHRLIAPPGAPSDSVEAWKERVR